ncbi:MAG: HU family DNA-binding protein [Desulfosarcinaceae bacterium]|nr:HU family DNA-binding protein [Desulfosarcinaceae bacterium]
MTKAELVEALKSENGFTREQAARVVGLFFESVTSSLEKGERVEIRGFGSFATKDYKPYIGRNPKTGEAVKVSGKKLPFFRCGKELRGRVDIH